MQNSAPLKRKPLDLFPLYLICGLLACAGLIAGYIFLSHQTSEEVAAQRARDAFYRAESERDYFLSRSVIRKDEALERYYIDRLKRRSEDERNQQQAEQILRAAEMQAGIRDRRENP